MFPKFVLNFRENRLLKKIRPIDLPKLRFEKGSFIYLRGKNGTLFRGTSPIPLSTWVPPSPLGTIINKTRIADSKIPYLKPHHYAPQRQQTAYKVVWCPTHTHCDPPPGSSWLCGTSSPAATWPEPRTLCRTRSTPHVAYCRPSARPMWYINIEKKRDLDYQNKNLSKPTEMPFHTSYRHPREGSTKYSPVFKWGVFKVQST